MSDALFSVADQVVLVSGGSRGIGRAIAEGFAQRGAKVIITGRDAATLEQTAARDRRAGGTVRPIVCDVADARGHRPARRRRCSTSSAASTRCSTSPASIAACRPRSSPRTTTTSSSTSTSRGRSCCRWRSARHMLERGRGNQINIVSLNNDRPLKGVMPYAMSKAGLGHMTRVAGDGMGPARHPRQRHRAGLRPHRPDEEALVAAERCRTGARPTRPCVAWASRRTWSARPSSWPRRRRRY